MKIIDNTVLYVNGNTITYVHAYTVGPLIMAQNIRLELNNPKITAIDDKGNDVKVELGDIESTLLYDKKFINKREHLLFVGKNLHFVVTFDSKSVFIHKPINAEGEYTVFNKHIVEEF